MWIAGAQPLLNTMLIWTGQELQFSLSVVLDQKRTEIGFSITIL
jgi:hypothetical protein